MAINKVRRRKIFSIIAVLLLFGGIIIYSHYAHNRDVAAIKKNLKISSARIYDLDYNKNPGWFFRYKFQVGEKSYYGTTSDRGIHNYKEGNSKHFIGQSLIVVFDSTHPNTHEMLIEEKDFAVYDLAMPANMGWTSRYIPHRDPAIRLVIFFLFVFVIVVVKFMRS
ncbi:MAG: hypothetical protein JNL72_14885 [Flavipsychrobacter sp.]|nr:hypothetical protein [Flavipsychrobacter sp.]